MKGMRKGDSTTAQMHFLLLYNAIMAG